MHCQILVNSDFECEKLIYGHFTKILVPIFIFFTVTFLHPFQLQWGQWEAGASKLLNQYWKHCGSLGGLGKRNSPQDL